MDNLKAGVKNAANKTSEVAENTSLKTRIANLEYETDKLYKELGIAYYERPEGYKDRMKELCDSIKSNLEQINSLKVGIDKNKSEGKAAREANWKAARDASTKSDDDEPEEKGGVEKIEIG